MIVPRQQVTVSYTYVHRENGERVIHHGNTTVEVFAHTSDEVAGDAVKAYLKETHEAVEITNVYRSGAIRFSEI